MSAPSPRDASRPPGRSALVTGASSGIGRAIARVLGDEGYALTVSSRRAERLAPAADEFRRAGLSVLEWPANLVVDDDVHALVATHEAEFGDLDVLVNNAGGGILAPFAEVKPKHIDLQLELNLHAPIRLTKLCLPLLQKAVERRGRATIVNVASFAGKIAQRDLAVYSAAKHGLVGFNHALNRELSADGVVSVVLCPTLVDTELTEPYRDQVAPGEMILPEDLAEGVRYVLRRSAHCLIPEMTFLRDGAELAEG